VGRALAVWGDSHRTSGGGWLLRRYGCPHGRLWSCGRPGCRRARADAARQKRSAAGAQQPTMNWYGPGESDCLI